MTNTFKRPTFGFIVLFFLVIANNAHPQSFETHPAQQQKPKRYFSEKNIRTKRLYIGCAQCHMDGVLGAPKFGSPQDWQPRLTKGIETLYKHAIDGINSMPPRGACDECTDEDIKAIVDYMISKIR